MAMVAASVVLAASTGIAGATVSVGVADTGVAPNLGGQLLPGWNLLAKNTDTSDWVWHGTFVAGLIQSASQGHAAVVPLRICNLTNVSNSVPPATCNAAAAGNAIKWAAQHGIRIVNDSITFSGANTTLRSAITGNPGVLVVAAAGNLKANIDSKPQYPCSFKLPNVICVTATTTGDVLWSRADFGQTVQLAAPGVNVSGRTPWTTQTFPANLGAGTNCEVQFRMKGSASPLTVTGTTATTSATIATWSGSLSAYKTATWPFPASLQGQSGVSVSFTGASGLTIQNPIAQCQGGTTQPFTSSGGSFSAAAVSGAAAQLEDEFPQATTAQIISAILNGATTDVTPAGLISGNRELSLAGATQILQAEFP
jgi:subtilase family protein